MTDDQPQKMCRIEQHPGETATRRCLCGAAHQMVRDFQPDERRFFLSRGQFSLVDLAVELTHQIGECDFRCAVWTGTRSVEQFDVTDSTTLCEHVGDFFDEVFSEMPMLSEEPPYDDWGRGDIEQTYQSLCLGDHFQAADVTDVSPIGVADGLR